MKRKDNRTQEERERQIEYAKCIADLARQVGRLKVQLAESELKFAALSEMYLELRDSVSIPDQKRYANA